MALDSKSKAMLESLRTILKEGPDDRFRVKLREAVDQILSGEMSILELPEYLRPVLRRLAVSYQGNGNVKALSACMALMRFS